MADNIPGYPGAQNLELAWRIWPDHPLTDEPAGAKTSAFPRRYTGCENDGSVSLIPVPFSGKLFQTAPGTQYLYVFLNPDL